jgi:hypothetical protein
VAAAAAAVPPSPASATPADGAAADGWFTLMLIAHTQRAVVLPRKAVG